MGMNQAADFRKYPARTVDAWVVGVDLGKSVDSTAISIIHHTFKGTDKWNVNHARRAWTEESIQRFDLVHLQRLPLGMNYVAQAHSIGEIMQREPLKSAGATLVDDQSGVGVGVVDLIETTGLRPIRLQITAGAEETQEWPIHRVAKTILISRLEAAMHSGELHVAASLTEAETLREELKDFHGLQALLFVKRILSSSSLVETAGMAAKGNAGAELARKVEITIDWTMYEAARIVMCFVVC